MCHEKCLKTLRKVCSSMTPSLVQVSIQHTLMLQTPNEPKCVTTDTGQCWPDVSGVGATRVKTGGRCCVRKQNLHLFHSQLLVRTDICTSIKPSCIENTKQTSLQDVFCNIHVVVGSDWNRTETISSKMSQCGCFGSHPF